MFDNLFLIAGPLGTAAMLFTVLLTLVVACPVAGRMRVLDGRSRMGR